MHWGHWRTRWWPFRHWGPAPMRGPFESAVLPDPPRRPLFIQRPGIFRFCFLIAKTKANVLCVFSTSFVLLVSVLLANNTATEFDINLYVFPASRRVGAAGRRPIGWLPAVRCEQRFGPRFWTRGRCFGQSGGVCGVGVMRFCATFSSTRPLL